MPSRYRSEGLQKNPNVEDNTPRYIDLATYSAIAPDAGIFDEPFRCYKANHEWAKIIMGFVSWLAEHEVWDYDDINQRRAAAEQIEIFLRGVDCEDTPMLLRQNPDNSCQLQFSNDDGQSWQLAFDYSLCLNDELRDPLTQIINYINNQTNPPPPFDPTETTIEDTLTDDELYGPFGGEPPEVPDGCNEDAIWSAVVNVVDFIHDRNVDLLQNVAQALNVSERAERVISAIPAVGLLPIDEVVGFANQLGEDLLNEYNATVDTELLENTYCDLFCIAVSHSPCELRWNDIYNYFASKSPADAAANIDTLANLIAFVATGNWQGDEIFYHLSLIQLFISSNGQSWYGKPGLDPYLLRVAVGYNNPSSDWMLLCDECPSGWCAFFDFTVDNGGWHISEENHHFPGQPLAAQWVSGQGWQSQIVQSADDRNLLMLTIETQAKFVSQLTNANGVEFAATYSWTGTSFCNAGINSPRNRWVGQRLGESAVDGSSPSGPGTPGDTNASWTVNGQLVQEQWNKITLGVAHISSGACLKDDTWTLHTLQLRGVGVFPFPEEYRCMP